MTELAILYYFAAFAGIAFVCCYVAIACYRWVRLKLRLRQVRQEVRASREFYERNRGTWDTRSLSGFSSTKREGTPVKMRDRVSRVNGKAS